MIRFPAGSVRSKAVCLVAVAAIAMGLGAGPSVAAVPLDFQEPTESIDENGQPGLLSLTSSVLPLQIPQLEPGESFNWQIGLHLTGQPAANGSLEFIPYGGLMRPDTQYLLTAQRCETQWTGRSGVGTTLGCASGAETLMADVVISGGATPQIPLGDVVTGTSPHILFTMTRPLGSAPANAFTFALGFTVMGDDITKDNSTLPYTGSASGSLLAAAAAILGAGLMAVLFGRRKGKV